MTTAMRKHLGIEAVVDAMMYHLHNETIQENGAAVIANIASVDLGAKRQARGHVAGPHAAAGWKALKGLSALSALSAR